MITYDWLRVYKHSGGNSVSILSIVAYITFQPLPKNKYDPITKYQLIDWSGDSFLVNPAAVIYNRTVVDQEELATYVALASFRSLAEYKVTGRKTLMVEASPLPVESLTKNSLLSIQNGEIYFCWEETTH